MTSNSIPSWKALVSRAVLKALGAALKMAFPKRFLL